MKTPVAAVVGGGFGGLVAARELKRAGVPVRVFEASSRLGGLARSSKDERGFSFDFGAHFITNRLAHELGAGHLCRDVGYYGESVVAADRTYAYPFGFLRNPTFVYDFVRARLQNSSSNPANAAELFRAMYGAGMADGVAIPILEGWSGTPAEMLAPAVVEKLDEGVLKTAWLRVAGRLTRRAVTIGYTREKPSSPSVWHVYPVGGLGSIIEHMAQELSDEIQLESPVSSIVVEDERVVGIRVNDDLIPVRAVLNTAPVHILSRLVEGTDLLSYLADFKYRPMVFVNLLLEGRGLLPDVVLWMTDKALPFFRLTETPLSMPWLAPEGKTIIMADLACDVGDATWTASDEELASTTLDALEEFIPDVFQRLIGHRVMRTPIAYPLFLLEYERQRQAFAAGSGVEGLYSIGRNGEFAHILMEDVYWRTRRRVSEVVDHLGE